MNSALRIHDPEAAPAPTLESVFETHMLPELEVTGTPGTIKNYRSAIRKFAAFCRVGKSTTSTLATPENLTDATITAWRSWMLETEGLKPSTVNKHWKNMRAILNYMADRLKLIETVPRPRPIPQPAPKRRIVDLGLLDSLYRFGAADMNWPANQPAKIWRAWMVCAYNLGMRKSDSMRLRWESIHWEPESLDPDSLAVNRFGWVQWIADKTSKLQTLPLNEHVHRHLKSVEGIDHEFVFGREFSAVTEATLYDKDGRPGHWSRLQNLAAAHHDGPFPRFEIRTIRATTNTHFNRLKSGLGKYVLGHAAQGVNDQFYQQWEGDAIKYAAQLPQPEAFTTPIETDRQTFLF